MATGRSPATLLTNSTDDAADGGCDGESTSVGPGRGDGGMMLVQSIFPFIIHQPPVFNLFVPLQHVDDVPSCLVHEILLLVELLTCNIDDDVLHVVALLCFAALFLSSLQWPVLLSPL